MPEEEIPVLRSVALERFEHVLAQAEREAGKKAEVAKIGIMSVVNGKPVVNLDRVRLQYSVDDEVIGIVDSDTGRCWLQEKYALTH